MLQQLKPVNDPLPIDLAQIQGLVLRGYGLTFVRHFALTVQAGAEAPARAFIGSLVDGKSVPQIQSAAIWTAKPRTCVNVSFTKAGLLALGISEQIVSSQFNTLDHSPFYNGMAADQDVIGDVGESAPANWILDDTNFDVMLSLWGQTLEDLEAMSTLLRERFSSGMKESLAIDSQDLADGQIYFGYRDGIAQPILDGNITQQQPDGGQPQVDPGGFILGTAQLPYFQAINVPQPPPFGQYGAFGAFRMLRQHIDRFEAFLDQNIATFAKTYGFTDQTYAREALKASLLGRWSNGTSLIQWPIQKNALPPELPDDQINDFEYASDPKGYGCPFSSHIRRSNPRDGSTETPPVHHRIMRRAMPYQIPYDPNDRQTGETGLVGFFMSASLQDGFRFLMSTWINADSVLSRDPGDPLMGDNYNSSYQQIPNSFSVMMKNPSPPPISLKQGFIIGQPFTTTRAGAYCFFPGLDGIGWIASGPHN